ncbi:MAG: hypothetical protein ACXAC2_07785, partial [Candidatus Kariarchaeaceae archaeon]
MLEGVNSNIFIEEWLNHFNLQYEKDRKAKKKNVGLHYYLPEYNTGVIIMDESKSVNVTTVNNALKTLDHFNLQDLIIITPKISDNAYDTINRLSL